MSKNTPFISIIIPVYNRASVLAETLKSAQAQTLSDWEVIMVDDASTDESVAVAEGFVKADPRFKLFRLDKNAGQAVARNRAVGEAQGEWLAFLDADDIWFPEKLQRQCDLLKRYPNANLLYTNYFVWDGSRDLSQRYKRREKMPEGAVLKEFVRANQFGTSTMMVPRKTLLQAGQFDSELRLAQDWDLFLRMAEWGLEARGIFQPLVRYRVWDQNVSKNEAKMIQFEIKVLKKGLERAANPTVRRFYADSLALAEGRALLAKAAEKADDNKNAAAALVREAARRSGRMKWRFWSFGAQLPGIRELVFRRLKKKWPPSNKGSIKDQTWQEVERFNPDWKKRIQMMAGYLPPKGKVLDVGCGPMWLREFLPGREYLGIDYVDRGPGCLVADLNKDPFPECEADAAFVSGCVEYLNEPGKFFADLRKRVSVAVVSHCALDYFPEMETRRKNAWVNHYTISEFMEVIRPSGFEVELLTRQPYTIFRLVRSGTSV